MVYVTAIHLVGGSGHEHIEQFRWRDATTNAMKDSSQQQMIDYIERDNGVVKVTDGVTDVLVGVVAHRYLRTYADKVWTNNLLALPKF